MRILFASLCVAVVDVSSHADPSNIVSTLGPIPLQAAYSEGPTKRHLRVDKPTDEERVIPADVGPLAGALVANFIFHQLEPIVDATVRQVEPVVLKSMISNRDYKNVLATKSLSPFELYTALGLQEMSKQKEFRPNNQAFHMENNVLFFFNWNRLKSYISCLPEMDEEVKKTVLNLIYLEFCNGDEGEVKSLIKALDTANHPKDGIKELAFLQNGKTPKNVLDEWNYRPSTYLFAWKHMRLWKRYVDLYKKVHYDQRIDAVAATGIEESVLITMVLRTEQAAHRGSLRKWMQDWLIEDWRDKHYPPSEVYTLLGLKLAVAPDYDGYPFFIWMEYIDYIDKETVTASLERILTRETIVKSLSSSVHKGTRTRFMINDAIIHLKKEKEKMELKNLDTTEVDNYLQDLNADETRGGRMKRQKGNK